jgi:hypothetical protein
MSNEIEASKSWDDAKEIAVKLSKIGTMLTDDIPTQMLAHAFVIQSLIYSADKHCWKNYGTGSRRSRTRG